MTYPQNTEKQSVKVIKIDVKAKRLSENHIKNYLKQVVST